MIFVIGNMSCKCVRSITNRSGPLHMKEQSVVSSHIVDFSIDSYMFKLIIKCF